MKYLRIALFIVFLVLSVAIIYPRPSSGYMINSLTVNASQSTGLKEGDIIYKINDVGTSLAMFSGDYYGSVKLDTSRGVRYLDVDGSLGISAEPAPFSNIKFGLDIKGGIRAVIQPEKGDRDTVEQIISTLQTRINVFGLKDAVFRPIYTNDGGFVEVSIAGGTKKELEDILKSQGYFEAKIPLGLTVRDGSFRLQLKTDYTIKENNGSLIVQESVINPGENFTLDGVVFYYDSKTANTVNLVSTVFTSDDIKTVFFDPQRSTLQKTDNGYTWSFAVQISPDGAKKFAYVTKNLGVVSGGYLDSQIYLYLDKNLIDSLNIVSTLKGREETEISITGSSSTFQEAVNQRTKLQSILRSGALPTTIEIVEFDSVSPTLGEGFLKNTLLAGLTAIVGVAVVVSIRYRKWKIILPMMLISVSEVIITVGMATAIGWTIDLVAIAGIIAAVGTGIDAQIVIIDQATRSVEQENLRQKLKNAFFVIFGSGGTVIAAMIPLITLGFGALRGFAIVTIIGVFVGILIARPAFGEFIEKVLNK